MWESSAELAAVVFGSAPPTGDAGSHLVPAGDFLSGIPAADPDIDLFLDLMAGLPQASPDARFATRSATQQGSVLTVPQFAGVDLADLDLVAGFDPQALLSDDALVTTAVAAGRIAAWAGAVQARAAALLAQRYRSAAAIHAERVEWRPPGDAELAERGAITEIALACGSSANHVADLLDVAHRLGRTPTGWADWTSGRLDSAKARGFVVATNGVAPRLLDAVYCAGAARPGGVTGATPAQLRARWVRAAAELDPAGQVRQARAALEQRRVETYPTAPGVAAFTVTGPDLRVAQARAHVDALAKAVRAAASRATDPRTLDQIRADVALELLLGHRDQAGGCEHPTPVAVTFTVPFSTAVSSPDLFGDLTQGLTWRCAVVDDDPASSQHRALLAVGPHRATPPSIKLGTGFTTNYVPGRGLRDLVATRDARCRFPGCRQPAHRCDLDHRTPHAQGGPTCDCNLQVLCRGHHRLKHEGGYRVRTDSDLPDDPRVRLDHRAHPDRLTWTTPTGRSYSSEPEPDSPPF